MGILLPIVRGGSAMGWPLEPVGAAAGVVPVDPYGRSKRDTTGLAGSFDLPNTGFSSVQSAGGGEGLKPSTVAWGTTMLIRFSIFVSSSPWSLAMNVNALPL